MAPKISRRNSSSLYLSNSGFRVNSIFTFGNDIKDGWNEIWSVQQVIVHRAFPWHCYRKLYEAGNMSVTALRLV